VLFGEGHKEISSSFLKKRSKKLLLNASNMRVKWAKGVPTAIDKSFLLLFFKKEDFFFPILDDKTRPRGRQTSCGAFS
jgi:hypothetical protein